MSLVINADKILALDQKGILYLIKADPEKLNILSEREVVDGESWAHLGIQGNKMMINNILIDSLVAMQGRATRLSINYCPSMLIMTI